MKKIVFYSACIILFLTSCITSHSGMVSSGPLITATDKYVDICSGYCTSVFVLGIGDAKKQEMINDAKKDLYRRRPLQKGEYYSNFATDINKKWMFFIVQKIAVSVSADILHTGDTSSFGFGNSFIKKITQFIPPKNKGIISADFNGGIIINGDSVYYSYNSKNYSLYVVSSLDKESAVLLSTDPAYKSIMVSVKQNYFFVRKDMGNAIKINEKTIIPVLDSFTEKFVDEEGYLMGYAGSQALVKTKSGFHVVSADKLKNN